VEYQRIQERGSRPNYRTSRCRCPRYLERDQNFVTSPEALDEFRAADHENLQGPKIVEAVKLWTFRIFVRHLFLYLHLFVRDS